MSKSFGIVLITLAFATGWLVASWSEFSKSPNFSWGITSFLVIVGLTLSSFWVPQLRILSFAIASITLFYGFGTSGNKLYLIGAIGLLIPVIVSLMRFFK